jgi:uncharacterized protein (DUF58 family)
VSDSSPDAGGGDGDAPDDGRGPGDGDDGQPPDATSRVGADATASSRTDAPADRVTDHATGHWRGIGAVGLVLGGLGLVFGSPGLVLSGLVGAVFAGYAGAARPLRVRDGDGDPVIAVRRRVDPETPAPGDAVTVDVEVHNGSDGVLPDVRVVDGVPPALPVIDGSPRHGAVLRPGGRARFSYTVRAVRGEHQFDPARVVVADPTGAVERETALAAGTTVTCRPDPSPVDLPLRGLASPYAGRIETDAGGEGVEFFATREYRRGDPPGRIDWNRRARTGDLATLEFRRERAATVALVVDVRRAAYVGPGPDRPHAVERGVDAAGRAFEALLDAGDRAGLAALGRGIDDAWLAPGTGRDHRADGRDLLATHPAFSPVPPEAGLYDSLDPERREALRRDLIDRLHRRLPAGAQVVLCAPCCDPFPVAVARRLTALGHPVTLLSPDPTADDRALRALAGLERADRLDRLRRAGVRVIDWGEESLPAALARASRGWSR